MRRNSGKANAEREMAKRSHGLLDNLLRPPPPPSGVSLEDRIAEEIVDSLTTASRRKRDTDSIDESAAAGAESAASSSAAMSLSSRGISGVELSPPLLARLLTQTQRSQHL